MALAIEQDAKKIEMYKQHLYDIEKRAEEKMCKILKDNFYQQQNENQTTLDYKEENEEDKSIKGEQLKKGFNFKKKKEAIEYRWAFGQKIPVDGEWVVKQKPAEVRQKEYRQKKDDIIQGKKPNSNRKSLNFVSDTNGRIIKGDNSETAIKSSAQKDNTAEKNRYYNSTPNKSLGLSQCGSETKLRINISNKKDAIPEEAEEFSPFKLPAWIADPFGTKAEEARKKEAEEKAAILDTSPVL